MKLPRLSDPTTVVYRDGEVTTEITTASHFDLMPTWAQWAIATFAGLLMLALVLTLILHK